MRRVAEVSRACAVVLAILWSAVGAQAQPRASSDLLVPFFEVDLGSGEATTSFWLSNQLASPVDVLATVQTNWGVPVLSIPLKLKAGELLTVDLRDWLLRGELPGRELTAAELIDLQAVLSGERSPRTGLYYATAAGADRAVGSIAIRTLGSRRPDALRGEYLLVDTAQGSSRGGALADIDASARPAGLCARQTVRHLAGSDLASSQVVLWMSLAGEQLPAPDPEDRRRQVNVSVFSPSGQLLNRRRVPLLPSQRISLADLGLSRRLGRIVLVTDVPSWASVLAGGGTTFEATCGGAQAPQRPAVKIVTRVAGQDANTPPGPSIPVGSPVQWRYQVSNTGAGALSKIAVTDDQGVSVRCPKKTLQPGQAMTCTAQGTAAACQQKNVGSVRATGLKGVVVTSRDPSHWFGDIGDAIALEVTVNNQDADEPTGPQVAAGSVLSWTYQVTNQGTVRLFDVEVVDELLGKIDCPKVSLAPGEPMTCYVNGLAAAGQLRHLTAVTATSSCREVSATDATHYLGESTTGLELRALTNGFDADTPPGPSIPVGDPVTWEYVITNRGKLPVSDLGVGDDRGGAVSCPGGTLQPGQSMTCLRRGVAVACQYSNFATATGRTAEGEVAASDPSHYFGQAEAALQIETTTNGSDADLPPGPTVATGNPVQWSYGVTNIGKVVLTGVAVTDDRGVAVTCPKTDLRPGESMTCLASGTALAGQYRNLATVTARPPCGSAVSDDDPSHYVGSGSSGILLQKLTNGEDANLPPGPTIPVGGAVAWSYVVTNTGQISLSRIAVSDDRGVVVTCPKTVLQAGESMTCLGQGVAEACQYNNLGTVTALTPSGQQVVAVDLSHYTGQAGAGVQIETATNGAAADEAPGPTIQVGSPVTWTYTVTNSGALELSGLRVSDDHGALVVCPQTTLRPGESMICSARGTAVEGQFRNVGTVTATPPCGSPVTAEDASHYFGGGDGALDLQKLTNGQDVDEPPGPAIPLGQPVTWTYRVTNSGRVSLSAIAVTDNRGVSVVCPKDTLVPGEAISCLGTGRAQACQYDNLGIATGKTATGQQVMAADLSYYFGQIQAGVSLETRVNGQDADTAPGPTVPVGSTIAWTYTVTNSGNVPLANVLVSDPSAAVACPKTALQPGEQMVCTASGTAVEGPFRNLGRATASPPCGSPVVAEDASHYLGGGTPVLQIQKLVNGQDAAQAPGPSIPIGTQILWTYVVSNAGQVTVSQIRVTDDDPLLVVSCPQETLQSGASMTCRARGTARACQYSNVGTVSGLSSGGGIVTATDSSYYFGEPRAAVRIETATNGYEADAAPGPTILVGSPVTWTYTVTNTGNVPLADILVSDDQGPQVVCPRTALQPGESMVCSARDTAVEGQYGNTGSVTATPPCGSPVTAQDPSHYVGGGNAGIGIEKLVNGQDISTPPGLTIPLGQPVAWTYRITNTGQVSLSGVAVTDNRGVSVICPKSALQPGETMSCTGTGTAQACQYDNLGIATGRTAGGQQVSALDQSYYFGEIAPRITLETSVNGRDADQAPFPAIQVGSTLTWAYTVTNAGNVALSGVRVSDDSGFGVTCPKAALQPGEQMTCHAMTTAVEGPAGTVGRVTADPPCGTPVAAEDPARYVGTGVSGLGVQKLTNGQDTPWPGPLVPIGQPVTWTYVVTNSGQLSLTGVSVDDDDPAVQVTCPKTTLQPGEAMTCTSNRGTARACQYVNLATAAAQSSGGAVTAYDPGYYNGQFQAAVEIETSVNGEDADAAPGPSLSVGSTVSWTYRVVNAGNVPLTNVKVYDDQGAAVNCGAGTSLQPGQSLLCTARGNAVSGQFRNVGMVTADPPCGVPVSATDASHYFGRSVGIEIQKLTNGQHVNQPSDLQVPMGSKVIWSYIVTNRSSVALQGIVVGDDKGVAVTCPKSELQPGESMACSGEGVAQACAYSNRGTATGVAAGGGTVSASDMSYYFGSPDAAIDLVMSIDGDPADVPPGATVAQGASVQLKYTVKNTGKVNLTNVGVVDDQGVTVSCPKSLLVPGESMECPVTYTVTTVGQKHHRSTATGTTSCGGTVSESDSTYYSVEGVDIEKSIATPAAYTVASQTSPGPNILWGTALTWRYSVRNAGNFPLTQVSVVDSDSSLSVSCPKTTLAVGEVMQCTAAGAAVCGSSQNAATATASLSSGATVSDSDAGYYVGTASPRIEIRSYVLAGFLLFTGDVPPGPSIKAGTEVIFQHTVTNTGDTPLTNLQISDPILNLGFDRCNSNPPGQLNPGETFTCVYTWALFSLGDRSNHGAVNAVPLCGTLVPASDNLFFKVVE